MDKKVLTIPNIISMFRILLVLVFIPVYFSNIENNLIIALGIMLVSGLSDLLDGFIARRFNMISDVGKVLDPIADKLTQAVILLCLLIDHPPIMPMFIVLFVKELLTAFVATYLLKNGLKPMSARWWGKLSTAIIYITIFYTITNDFAPISDTVLAVLVGVSIVCMLISLLGYLSIILSKSKDAIKESK